MRGKKLVKNIVLSLSIQIVNIVYGFIIPRLIIKQYGSNVNGLVSSITQFLGYITFLEAGIGPIIKAALYKPIAQKDQNTIQQILKTSEKFFYKIGIIFIVYLGILCIIYPNIVNDEFNYLFTVSLILILSLSTFAQYFSGITYSLYLQAKQESYVIYIIRIALTILTTIVTIVLIKLGFSIQKVELVISIIFVMKPVLQNIYVKRKYKINLKKVEGDYKLKQKWDGLSQHIAYIIHTNTDIAILTFFANMSEVSVYYIYSLVTGGIRRINNSFSAGVESLLGDMLAKNEKEKMNKTFNMYEFIYLSLVTIIFSVTFIMIIPFVSVYTRGINDANYIRPTFAVLIVAAELAYTCRHPYLSITFAAGHFKPMSKGAWVEAISNLAISILLAFFIGIDGVAVGTLLSITIRTIEYMYYSSKHLLNRKISYSLKRILVMIVQITIILFLSKIIFNVEISNYLQWGIYAVIATVISSVFIIGSNILIYNNDSKEVIILIKNILKRRKQT